MKKFLYSFVILAASALMLAACGDKTDDPVDPNPEPTPDPTPDPVEKVQNPNTWIFNDGDEVAVGSLLIFESSDVVTAYFSAEEGLDNIMDFEETDDYTQITFPVSAIGSEINLAALTKEDGTYILSKLPEFGGDTGLVIDGAVNAVSEGKLSSSSEDDEMSIKCNFTTLDTNIKCSIYLSGAVKKIEPAGSLIEYAVPNSDISGSKAFGSGFYLKNTWDEGWTFSYSLSSINTYINIGNNTYVEIYAGSDQLLNGEPFDVATTEYPFSFKFEYLDRSVGDLVPVVIDNNNREGASGNITFTQNINGLYDVQFALTLKDGDVVVSGYYADVLQPRNMIYETSGGRIGMLRSATLDISADPCVLYLSTENVPAGPDQYDIKCEVPAKEWRYGKFMAFSGQDAKITWCDGVCYNKTTSQTTPIFGGNWRVFEPTSISDGGLVTECTAMLFGKNECFAYYYGEITVIK